MEDLIKDLRVKKAELEQGGGADRLAKQRQDGKLTARDRVDALVDSGSFEEIGPLRPAPADPLRHGRQGSSRRRRGHRRGLGRRPPGSSGQPGLHGPRAARRASSTRHKVADVMELALHTGSPFVFINDSGGARVQEGIDSLSGYGRVFFTNVDAFRRGAADLADLWAVRRRRGLLARR